MKTIGYLGQIDKLFEAQVTTRTGIPSPRSSAFSRRQKGSQAAAQGALREHL